MSRTENIIYLNTFEESKLLSKNDHILNFLKHGIETKQLSGLLPSVRSLALLLSANKNTISKVMETLVWEEYLTVKPKTGYWCNAALVEFKIEQAFLPKKKLPILLPHSHKEIQNISAPITYNTLLSIHRNSKKWLNKNDQQSLFSNHTELLKSFISKYINYQVDTEDFFIYAHSYWLRFQLLHTLLQDGDQIIIDRNEIADWPLTLQNKNIKIIPFPQNQDEIITNITHRLKTNDSLRCIFIPRHLSISKTTLLNLLSLCYKYGVLLIQTQHTEHLHQTKHKPHFAKTYDYNNYVIHLIELPHQVSGIVCDQSIVKTLAQNLIQSDEWEQIKIMHTIEKVLK